MSKKPNLDIPVCVLDYVKITSYWGDNEPTAVIARITKINHVKGRGTTAVLSLPSNDRHSFPPDLVFPVKRIKDTGFINLPFRLPNRKGQDYFQRISSEDVPEDIKSRFSN